MSDKAIVINSNGKQAEGVVTDISNVRMASETELDNVIGEGLLEVAKILSGEVEDPTKKKCSRCFKKGRVFMHPVDDFSLLQNGKRHSQCKVCRTEQAVAWEAKAKHRKEYHKGYQAIRKPAQRVPKALKNFVNAMTEAEGTIQAKEALFVATPQTEVEDTQAT